MNYAPQDSLVHRSGWKQNSIVQFAAKRVIAVFQGLSRQYIQHFPGKVLKLRLLTLYWQKLYRWPRTVRVRTRLGFRMELSTPDLVSGTIYICGEWEPTISEYVCKRLLPGDVFIDVGANIGYYSLLASRLVGEGGTVVSIEASPSTFVRLEKNAQLNDARNMTLVNAAASDRKGELSIFMSTPWNRGHSTTVAKVASAEHMLEEGRVPADTIVELAGKQLWTARFIKIDVEGAELAVLSPILGRLQDFHAETEWLIELSPDMSPGGQGDVDQIYRAFENAGYKCFNIPNEYTPEFQLNPGKAMRRLDGAPCSSCDVLMTRRPIQD
jgi:FkbM family methyltransferase